MRGCSANHFRVILLVRAVPPSAMTAMTGALGWKASSGGQRANPLAEPRNQALVRFSAS